MSPVAAEDLGAQIAAAIAVQLADLTDPHERQRLQDDIRQALADVELIRLSWPQRHAQGRQGGFARTVRRHASESLQRLAAFYGQEVAA